MPLQTLHGTSNNMKLVRFFRFALDLAWEKMADTICPTVHCDKYLCPSTLACVHFPHHCPCPHSEVEDKVELDDGSMVCVSKGGYKAGEAARKIELARKGLL